MKTDKNSADMADKVFSYLGFAAKSRNMVTGYNTCEMMMARRKIKLLIVAEDLAENTKKKMTQQCDKYNIDLKIFGKSEILSQKTGNSGKGIFGITDSHFAKIISEEIDRIQSEREVF